MARPLNFKFTEGFESSDGYLMPCSFYSVGPVYTLLNSWSPTRGALDASVH